MRIRGLFGAEKEERVSSSAHPASLPRQLKQRGTYSHGEIDAGYLLSGRRLSSFSSQLEPRGRRRDWSETGRREEGLNTKFRVTTRGALKLGTRVPSDRRPRRASGRNGVMECGERVRAFGDSIARRRPSLGYCDNTASAPPPLQKPILLPTYREQARCSTPPTAHAHRLMAGWPPRSKPDQTRPDPAHNGGGNLGKRES